MSELEQLKQRIDASGPEGILTRLVRDDYEPAGDLMMHELTNSGGYVQRRDPEWKIFKKEFDPYSGV